MDPLAELVKIDPKSIGVGQYQHDVDQAELKKSLDDTVMSCVNAVGVEVNSASRQLLAYVSGLGPQLAGNIVAYREANGPFCFEAGFQESSPPGAPSVRAGGRISAHFQRSQTRWTGAPSIRNPTISWRKWRGDLGSSIIDLIRDADLRKRIDPSRYVTEDAGLPTLLDILSELAKPGRDPRKTFEAFSFAPGIEKVTDLEVGMKLPGIVTNVTAFGAFVDIGVHRDGLVHVSELSDGFVKDPGQVVRVHQHVMVTVLEVDLERSRIALSMKSGKAPKAELPKKDVVPAAAKARPEQKSHPDKKAAFNNPFAEAFRKK